MDWKRFFDALGMNGTHWQWRMIRWQKRWEEWRDGWLNKKDFVSSQHKFCRACGALLTRDEKTCPRCSARAPSYQAQRVRRVFALSLPTFCPATTLLLGIIVVIGAVQLRPDIHRVLTNAGAYRLSLVLHGEAWRVITYAYLHSTTFWMHLLFNALALSQVGPIVEQEIGTARYFSAYTLTAVGAALFSSLVNPMMGLVGASGALFGLIGFGVAYYHFLGGGFARAQRAFFLQWAMYGLLFGLLVPGVANAAHVGGLLTGAALGWLVERERSRRDAWTRAWRSLATVLVLLTVASFVLWAMECGT